MDNKELITAIVTVIGVIVTAYVSWKLGRLQLNQQSRQASMSDGTLREIELREDLLQLLDKQEEKLKSQDNKIGKLDSYIEQMKTLVDELKRANLNLVIENQRLKRRIDEVEEDAAKLRVEIETLKRGVSQHAIDVSK